MKKNLLLIACVFALTGCASFSQAVSAYSASGKVAVEAANDNIVTGIKDATCALPYGALLRHQEMQGAAQSLCGVMGAPVAAPIAK